MQSCMRACLYIRRDGWMHACMHACMDGCMDKQTGICTPIHICIYIYIYVCVCVFIYIYALERDIQKANMSFSHKASHSSSPKSSRTPVTLKPGPFLPV